MGAIAERFPGWLAQITVTFIEQQKSVLLGKAITLRHVPQRSQRSQDSQGHELETDATSGWVRQDFDFLADLIFYEDKRGTRIPKPGQ